MSAGDTYKGLFTGFYNKLRQPLHEGMMATHKGQRLRIVWAQDYGQWQIERQDAPPVSLAAWLTVRDFRPVKMDKA